MMPIRLLSVTALLAPLPAFATVQVNGVGPAHETITLALAAATSGDTLNVSAGTYTEAIVVDDDITIIGSGTVTWNGAGVEIIRLTNGASLTLQNLTIRGNNANRRAINSSDGNSTIVLDDVDIDSDSTGNGGILYAIDPDSITIRNSKLAGSSTGSGGAIYTSSATSYIVNIDDTTFVGSTALNGGAIYTSGGTLQCTRCTFDDTVAGSFGGAIYVTGGSFAIDQSLFCDTNGANGGALYGAPTSDSTIRSTRFVETTAAASGGALFVPSTSTGTWTVENNHFLGTSTSGSHGVIEQEGDVMTTRNNLFYTNTGYAINRTGGTHTAGYNWYQGNTLGTVNSIPSNANAKSGEPHLVSWTADSNCGNDSLWSVPLDAPGLVSANSPLLDAGDPASTYNDPDGSPNDIGAYGGPYADPAFHADTDGDNAHFLYDCDDNNDLRFPTNTELCDDIDNDCNDDIDDDAEDVGYFYEDCDDDDQGATNSLVISCDEPPPGDCPWLSQAVHGDAAWQDCNDANDAVYFGADETCSPGDQNCDGDNDLFAIDGYTWYADVDADSFGSDNIDDATTSCSSSEPPGPNTANVGGDCDDTNLSIYPGAPDSCGNDVDEDCNGGDGNDATIVDWYLDADNDGYGDNTAAPERTCADLSPNHTLLADALDCDDDNNAVNPDALEVCNTQDDDCNGLTDDVGPDVSWYPDGDNDGFGLIGDGISSACPPDGYIDLSGDCDDANNSVNPDALESCNLLDDDCDGKLDAEDEDVTDAEYVWTDWDRDGFGTCGDSPECAPYAVCSSERTDSHADNADDCNDTDPNLNPFADEVAGNDLDENCDGQFEAGAPPQTDGRGCNCASTPAPGAGLLLGVNLLALLGLRRRH